MLKKSLTKRITVVLSVILLLVAGCPVSAHADTFAADSGQHYLDTVEFTNYTWGRYHTFNTKWVQFIVTWRSNDGGSDISFDVQLYRIRNGQSEFIGSDRLTPSRDWDGKDGNGYYYAGTKWFNLFENQEYRAGDTYQLRYEAFTAPGQKGTGRSRSGFAYIDVNCGSRY